MIYFQNGNIFTGSGMTENTEEKLTFSDVGQFVEYLTDILASATPLPTPELRKLMSRFKRLNAGESFHTHIGPFAFGRMGNVLYKGDRPTMGELSKALSLPLSTMTRVVDAGESFGLVERLPDPNDGRIVRVSFTADGRRLYEVMRGRREQGIKKVLACLTPAERDMLLTLLRKVATSIKRD